METKGAALNKEIAALALPNVVSNVTVPLMGMADVAIAGYTGGDASIGGISIGTTVFNMIYWNCSFLRMGGSGLTAQHYGAGRGAECALTLVRLLCIALAMSLLLLAVKAPLTGLALRIMGAPADVEAAAAAYIGARYWAIPASVCLFALSGWFIGMQRPQIPMAVAIVGNIVNIGASMGLAVGLEMGVEGVAWGTVAAQYASLAMALALVGARFGGLFRGFEWRRMGDRRQIGRLAGINRDIFLRTLCLVCVFSSFTALSARHGATVLAANALMMQFFTLFSYMTDGLAYAAESLVGRLVGAGERAPLSAAVGRLTVAGAITALAYTAVFALWWREILSLFSPSEATLAEAGARIGWALAMPLVCFFAFIADGIMVGATRSAAMRDTMALATAIFFAAYFALRGAVGADALWVAFLLYMLMRGLLLLPHVRRLTSGPVCKA